MIIDVQELLTALRSVKDRGTLQQVFINLNGTLTAVYSGGLVQIGTDGKVK